jgi:hypothetical protein
MIVITTGSTLLTSSHGSVSSINHLRPITPADGPVQAWIILLLSCGILLDEPWRNSRFFLYTVYSQGDVTVLTVSAEDKLTGNLDFFVSSSIVSTFALLNHSNAGMLNVPTTDRTLRYLVSRRTRSWGT